MSVHGVDAMQSWTDSRLAPVTHDVAAADLRLYGDDVDDVWTPQLHVINARRRLTADRHRVLAVSTGGLVILHQRYVRPSRHCTNPPRRGGVAASRSGNVVGRINKVALRRARIVLGRVTVFGRANHLSNQYFTKPPRPTRPPTLSGAANEYQPKCGDALRLGSKGRYGSFHLWIKTGKTV